MSLGDLSVFAKYMDIPDEIKKLTKEKVKAESRHQELELNGIANSIESAHWKHDLIVKICSWCNKKFQTNYCHVSYCSVSCVSESLEMKGIKYRDVDSNYEPAITIKSSTTEQLYRWAKRFIKAYETAEINAPNIADETLEERPQYHSNLDETEDSPPIDAPISLHDNLKEVNDFFDTL